MKTILGWLVMAVLLLQLHADRILIILDNAKLLKTHSKMIGHLDNIGSVKNQVEIGYSFGKNKIQLKNYDRFLYEHIIVMCTSTKESQSKIKVKEIISYFDEGGNVLVIGDIDIALGWRKLFQALGVEVQEHGSRVKDHFNNDGKSTTVLTNNYMLIPPFFTPRNEIKPLAYRGIGLECASYETNQLYNLVKAESTTIVRNFQTSKTTKAGTTISMLAAVQGINNARAVVSGSLDFFSDEFWNESNYGNQEVCQDLLRWLFHKAGVIRVNKMHYHGDGTLDKQTLFNVGEKLYFNAEVVEYSEKHKHWEPYVADNLQVELVMLDPWVRANLATVGNSVYSAEFYAPQKEGIYQFKILYNKPGYNFVKEAQRVTIRPYKHDEFERFLFVAYPYFFGLFSTIIATFLFVILYLYSGFGKSKVE